MKPLRLKIEQRIALIYLIFGVLWIFFSDLLLTLLTNDPEDLTRMQNLKGWAFVLVSAGLIYSFLRHYLEIQRAAEKELAAKEERFRMLFNTSPDGILLTVPEGPILAANASACQILGRSEEELRVTDPSGVVDLQDPRLPQAISTRAETGHFHGEINFLRRNGERFPCEISAAKYWVGDGKEESAIILRDISDRKRAEEALQKNEEDLRLLNTQLEQRVAERTQELSIAVRKAQEADRLKSVFLATMSHELRTPLNSIIGFSGILSQGLAGPLNDEQNKQLGMVRQSAQHLLNLINDILDLSKIEAGQMKVSCAPCDLLVVIESVLQLAQPLAAKKGLALQAEIGTDIPVILSDAQRLKQILLNLVNNAVKFTPQGLVRVECRRGEQSVEISVRDTGIGIAAEDLPHLFRPFHQIESGPNRKHEGSGLGLSISHQLASLLGGKINVQSQPGEGSLFTLELPLKAPPC